MERFIEDGLEEGHCVVIIVDTEGDRPEDVKARIINEHFKDLGINNRNKIKIIVAHPCLEVWLAELLNINTKGVANCKNIKDIIKRHIKDYESHLLPDLIERHLRNRLEAGDAPSFLVEICSITQR
jgi:bifunctional DNA-binding transcriptional regulator/antitoxin component of YhaV-PrlF toxin-antitoxin module